MADYSRNKNEKDALHKIIRQFTDNPAIREYFRITELEADICKKVFIEEKLFSELAVPNKIKISQVKEMAAAPFFKVINRIKEEINGWTVTQVEDTENDNDSILKDNMLDISLDEFTISERTRRILKEHGIDTIAKLSMLDFEKLRFDKNYGVKTIFELQQLAGKLKDSREILSIHRKTGKQ